MEVTPQTTKPRAWHPDAFDRGCFYLIKLVKRGMKKAAGPVGHDGLASTMLAT
jgi:hypothetical protein